MYARNLKPNSRVKVEDKPENIAMPKKLEEPSLSKILKNSEPSPKDVKTVENQTVYYNIRKKLYDNRERKRNYFKEDQNAFLRSEDIQKKIFQADSVENILRLYNGHKFTFTTKNLVMTMHRLGKYLPVERKNHKNDSGKSKKGFPYKITEKRIQSLFFTIEQNFDTFQLSEKAIILWSITKMSFFDSDLFHKAVEDLIKNLDDLSLDQNCLVAWCLCKSNSRSSKFYGLLSLNIEKRISRPEFLKLFDNFDENVQNKIEIIDSSQNKKQEESEDDEFGDLLNIKLEKENLENKANVRRDKHPAQALSILFWSFAKKEIEDETLFKTLENIFFTKIDHYSLHSIALNLFALSSVKRKLSIHELDLIEKTLIAKILTEENTLTLKTILVLLDRIGISNNRGIYNKYLDEILNKNPRYLSPRFLCEILRVLVSKNLFDENYSIKFVALLQKAVKEFNLEDCLSSFESLCRAKKNPNTEKITESILIRLSMFENEFGARERKILGKITQETRFSHKIITKILQPKIGSN